MANFGSVFSLLSPGVRGVQPLINYNGTDITADILPILQRFQYRQIFADGFDSVVMVICDPTGKFLNTWRFELAKPLAVKIKTQNWRFQGDKQLISIGTFLIDEITMSFPPSTFTIKATPGATISKAKWSNLTRIWSGTLFSIATQIASEIGYKLKYIPSYDIAVDPQEQTNESDVVFLAGLCHRNFLSTKVSDNTITIFDQMQLDSQAPTVTITMPSIGIPGGTGLGVKQASFTASAQYNNFLRIHADGTWTDPFTGKVIGTPTTGGTIDSGNTQSTESINTFSQKYGPQVNDLRRPLLPPQSDGS
jgi:hypothetical protein